MAEASSFTDDLICLIDEKIFLAIEVRMPVTSAHVPHRRDSPLQTHPLAV